MLLNASFLSFLPSMLTTLPVIFQIKTKWIPLVNGDAEKGNKYVWAVDGCVSAGLLLCFWTLYLFPLFGCDFNKLLSFRNETQCYIIIIECVHCTLFKPILDLFVLHMKAHMYCFITSPCALHQGSHYTSGKQVGSALWELDGNHSSHYEPVLWDWDVCGGEVEYVDSVQTCWLLRDVPEFEIV